MSEDNRRKHKRYKVSWPCRLLLPSKVIVSARVKDISQGGVGIEVLQKLPDGQQVSFETRPMFLGKQYLVRAKGEVTFAMILGGTNGFSQGLRFTMIPDEHKKQLDALLKDLSTDK